MTRKDDKGDQPSKHDMPAESTRQGNLETACRGLRPTTGHNGCLMMMMMMMLIRIIDLSGYQL